MTSDTPNSQTSNDSTRPTDGLGGASYSWPAERGYGTLERPVHGRMLAGVAAGIADFLGVEVILVRIALVVLTLAAGIGIPLYIAGWLLIPDAECGWSIAEDVLHHAGLR
jgi:phage shock protein PspC (stress-responsive transcriptional regulator)